MTTRATSITGSHQQPLLLPSFKLNQWSASTPSSQALACAYEYRPDKSFQEKFFVSEVDGSMHTSQTVGTTPQTELVVVTQGHQVEVADTVYTLDY